MDLSGLQWWWSFKLSNYQAGRLADWQTNKLTKRVISFAMMMVEFCTLCKGLMKMISVLSCLLSWMQVTPALNFSFHKQWTKMCWDLATASMQPWQQNANYFWHSSTSYDRAVASALAYSPRVPSSILSRENILTGQYKSLQLTDPQKRNQRLLLTGQYKSL